MNTDKKYYDLIITGASGDIGPKIKDHFLSLGFKILCLDISDGHDLTDENFVKEIFLENHSSALINLFAKNEHVRVSHGNSGAMAKSIDDFHLDDVNKYFAVNVTALFSVCREYAKNNKYGSIVNFTSIYGLRVPNPALYLNSYKHIGYSTSKAAVIALSEYLAIALAPNIRVNVVAPGGIISNQDDAFITRYSEKCPMGRMAIAEDLLGLLELLVSTRSSYINGATFRVDGGWTIV